MRAPVVEGHHRCGQERALSLLSPNPTSDAVEDNHGTPPEQRAWLYHTSFIVASSTLRPAGPRASRMVCRFLASESDMPTVSIRFQNTSPTQHDPGLDALGAHRQLQPLGNAILWRPCSMPCLQATDACHLHHDVQLLSRCPAPQRP